MPTRLRRLLSLEFVLALSAAAVPAGLVARLPLPEGSRAVVALALLGFAPGWAIGRVRRRRWPEEDLLVALARAALLTAASQVVGLVLVGLLPVPLRVGLWLPTLLPFLWLLPSRAADVTGQHLRQGQKGRLLGGLLIAGSLVLAGWMLFTPADACLVSDAPAHLGGVHDALAADRFWPPDRSFPGASGDPDPRFGVLHGLYAALAEVTAASPSAVLAAVPVLGALLWWWGHAAWMGTWGIASVTALVLGLLFTVAGAGGRAFGLWGVGYPGNLALALAALAAAEIFRELTEDPPPALPRPPARVALVLLAGSVVLHPFAWWIAATTLLLAGAIAFPIPGQRKRALPILLRGITLTLAGTLLLLPRLLERTTSTAGLHQLPTDVVLLSDGRFLVDPLVLARWSGLGALLAGPLLLLRGRRFWTAPHAALAAAGVLLPWLLSLDPWIAPLAWSVVSYLLVRTGRWVLTPWWWWTGLREGIEDARTGPPLHRSRALLLAVLCAWLLVGEARTAGEVIGEGPARETPSITAMLDRMVEATAEIDLSRIASDPRVSYGLRARRGGAPPLYPLAHASPNDLGLPERLAHYRALFDTAADSATWYGDWNALGTTHLLLDLRPQTFAPSPEYGWIADPDAARALSRRLEEIGGRLVVRDEAFELWELSGAGWSPPTPRPLDAEGPAPDATPIARGRSFDVLDCETLSSRAAPGDTLELRLWLRGHPIDPPPAVPVWERVHVRLEGPMPALPGWTGSFDKLYRKFVVEKKGRSRSRFGAAWVPANGIVPPRRWPDGRWSETRRLVVPGHVPAGRYTVQVTIHDAPWRSRRTLDEYLHDRDRFSAPPCDSLWIDRPQVTTATAAGTEDSTAAQQWRAWLQLPSGRLPFGLELEDGPVPRAWIHNAQERLAIDDVGVRGDSLFLGFPHYDSWIRARRTDGGRRLRGQWSQRRGRHEVEVLPFAAEAGDRRRFDDEGDPTTARHFAGRWRVDFESEDIDAVGVFAAREHGVIEGTFLTATGDYRYLQGVATADKELLLSTFDGSHAFLFRAHETDDGRLAGEFWSGGHWQERWWAERDPQASLPDAFEQSVWKADGRGLGSLAFPDVDGRMRSLEDPEFSGRARILYLFGSWCPNCSDATDLLVEIDRRYRARGLSIVGLAFERTGDFDHDARQVRRYARRHDVRYPLLVAGRSDKEQASRAFPLLDRVRSYPTTIFIDGEGRVRAVYTGFSGPATGAAYHELRDEFLRLVQTMLDTSP